MRTTIDLPDDLHAAANDLARSTRQSLSEAIAELMRRGMRTGSFSVSVCDRTGLPVVDLGRVVTSEDVRSLDDDA